MGRNSERHGPLNVFAPSYKAFTKLPAGTGDNLLKPENKDKFAGALTCHMLAGEIIAADLKTMSAKIVNGKDVAIKVEVGKVRADAANVVETDIAAKNGVIRVTDTVLIP